MVFFELGGIALISVAVASLAIAALQSYAVLRKDNFRSKREKSLAKRELLRAAVICAICATFGIIMLIGGQNA